jgi:hypothetical protein
MDGPVGRRRWMDNVPQGGEDSAAIESAAAPVPPKLPGVTRTDAIVAPEPRVLRILRPAPRSIVRRVTERLMLGVVALALYAAWFWSSLETTPETQVLRGTIRPDEIAPAGVTIPTPAPQPNSPSWFSPQLLYVPTWTPAPSDAPRANVPLPTPRPTRQ